MATDTNRRQDGWHPVAGSCFLRRARNVRALCGVRKVQPGQVPEGDPHIATLKKDKEGKKPYGFEL